MLIPQFSIRWLLAITALCAGVFSIVALGVRGQRWALGVSAAIAALVILMLVYVVLFGVVWVFGSLTGRSGRQGEQAAGSPFTSPPSSESDSRLADPETPSAPILLE